jgi:hypothetical protein
MSTFVHKVNRGSLFVNEKKETDKHPDLTGTINVNGVLHFFKAWAVQPEEGKKLPVFNVKIGDKCTNQPAGAVNGDGNAVLAQVLAAVLTGRR